MVINYDDLLSLILITTVVGLPIMYVLHGYFVKLVRDRKGYHVLYLKTKLHEEYNHATAFLLSYLLFLLV